jgi:hypothetical protein
VVHFQLAPEKLDALRARFKLSEVVFRVQFLRLQDQAPAVVGQDSGKETSDD